MTIQKLYRNRMTCAAVLGLAALAIAAAGAFSDRIFFLPAAMMAVSAVICAHLAWTSYRFDLGKSGPPEWRQLVAEAQASAVNGDNAPEEPATGDAPGEEPSETH